MKRLLVLCVTALLAVGIYATTAGGGQQAGVTPKQFNALKKSVATIRKELTATEAVLGGCVMGNAVPVTQYQGYVYQDTTGATGVTTALDVTEQGGTPSGFVLLVNSDPTCVNLVNSTLQNFSTAAHTFRAATASRFVRAAKPR
jgi:uncharacterized protein YdeI (BOF family)